MTKHFQSLSRHGLLVVVAAQFLAVGQAQSWYNTSWTHRKQITIAHGQVSGGSALTNFPALISEASDSDLAASAQSNGNDILFTASDGATKLNHEIETYTSSTGQLTAWVQIPSLSATTDTVIYMYYGNAGASNQQSVTAVWDSNYQGVWHLPNGTTLSASDSTANGRNGTISSPAATAGEIGGGASFNGTSDGISFSPITTLVQTYTAEFWVNSTFPNTYMTILGGTSGFNDIYFDGSSNAIGVDNGTSFSAYSTASVSGVSVPSSTWTSLVVTRSGSTITVYKNGTLVGTGTFSTAYNTANYGEMGNATINYYGGKLDEVKISSNVRSAGWITTEYNNQSSPTSFLSVGGEQTNPVGTPTFNPAAGTYSSAQSVTISTTSSGASIRYTTDGSTPSETAGTLYSGPVTVSTSETLKAIAYESGFTDSSVASASYSIGSSSWYSSSWAYREPITINSGQVNGTLTNFPMLYSVTDSNLVGHTQSGGNDILFTASDGVTKLNHQIETYNSSSGQLVAWVQVPSLQTGTVIYVYYGNSGASNQQNPTGVWDSNYAGVWHLPNGTTLSAGDSTANGNNGTISSPTATAGQIDGGASFNGSSDGISFTAISNLVQTYTAEFWIYSSFPHAYMTILGGTSSFNDIYFDGTSNVIGVDNGTSFSAYSTASVSGVNVASNTWTSIAVSRSESSITVYKNGASVGTGTFSTAYNVANYAEMGNAAGANYYGGKLDEVKISSNVRSAGWIQTEYNNQSSPSGFMTVGSPQQQGGSTVTVTVTSSPSSLSLSVDSANCTAPCTFQWTPGSNHTIAVSTSPQSGGTGTQYIYASWSDSGAESHSVTVPSSSITYTANFTTQYYLTTSAGTGGSISPASAWENSGAVVSVNAAANSGYAFSGFSGALTGTTTPQNLTMSAAESVAANFSFNTGSSQVTTYTYDVWNNLSGVSMTRGSSTQTRTFVYNGPYLQSATNPENGTVTYTYNTTNNKIATKTDAKGQVVKYTYDSYARLTEVQRYPQGLSNAEDTCQQEQYFYDTNPFDSNYSGQYSAGRPTAIQSYGGSSTYSNGSGNCDTTFIEMYNYSQPGGKIGKRLRLTRTLEIGHAAPAATNLDFNSTYVYDTEGRMTSVQYPGSGPSSAPVTGPNLGWAFDTMGRMNTMTDLAASSTIISGATYGPSNELLTISGQLNESRSYNSMLQLTGLTSGSTVSMSYSYSSTQNNGKITSQTDAISGETVVYTYDALNRLASATATNSSWGQSYQYDGFGNLTNQNVTAGSAPAYTAGYDANNHMGCEDANGNNTCQVDGAGHGFVYDVENRPITLGNGITNPPFRYSYAPGNKRVWRGLFTSGTLTTDEVTFWGVNGQKLAVYQLTYTNQAQQGQQANWVWYASQTGTNYYFGGKLIKNAGGFIGADRLGSIGHFYPYGQEKPSATQNGTEKFTGYLRDGETGMDYAMNRYHVPGTGRFLTPDPYMAAANGANDPTNPGSWNRYAYVLGDPISFTDHTGRYEDANAYKDGDVCGANPDCDDIGDGGGGGGGASAATAWQDETNALMTLVDAAFQSASDRIANTDCAGLFLSSANNTPDNRKALSQELLDVPANGGVAIMSAQNAKSINPGIPAYVPDDQDVIIFVQDRAFFTGVGPDGKPLQGAFAGLSWTQIDDLIVIHEFMHYIGLIGPDNANQTYTLANGTTVHGSMGLSQAIRDNCFK